MEFKTLSNVGYGRFGRLLHNVAKGGVMNDTPLDLMKGARPDERFHLQWMQPMPTITKFLGFRKVEWFGLFLEDGKQGYFISYSIGGFQYYKGNVKCDGGRTFMLQNGQLGGNYSEQHAYVMTTTPKEMLAVRKHRVSDLVSWDNMGGS